MAIEIREGEEVPQEVIEERRRTRAIFQLAFRMYPLVLDRILEILHFAGPARDDRDIVLQNAAKMILHEAGWWGDDNFDRGEIVRKLSGITIPRRSFWQRLFRR